MGTDNIGPQSDAQARLLALKHEKAGYAQRGLTDRVKQVDAEIARWNEVAKAAAENPEAASEVRVNPEAAEAENRLRGLEDEKRGLAGRKDVEARVAAIDEQIRHYTGVVRKHGGQESTAAPEPTKPTASARR